MHMIHVECNVMTVKRVEGRIYSVHSFPIFSGKQRHFIFFSAVYVHCHCCFFSVNSSRYCDFPCVPPLFFCTKMHDWDHIYARHLWKQPDPSA